MGNLAALVLKLQHVPHLAHLQFGEQRHLGKAAVVFRVHGAQPAAAQPFPYGIVAILYPPGIGDRCAQMT